MKDNTEDISPEFVFESIAPPNSTQPIFSSFFTGSQTDHPLDELKDAVNENEITELGSQDDPNELIQSQNVNETIFEKHENSMINTSKDEDEINSDIEDEIQFNSNHIPTTLMKNDSNDINESNDHDDHNDDDDDDVFLNPPSNHDHDTDDTVQIEHDDDHDHDHEEDDIHNESIKHKETNRFHVNQLDTDDHIPLKRNYTFKSFELSISALDGITSKFPVLSRRKTLPMIKRKSKKPSTISPNQVQIRGKRFKSDNNDYSTLEEELLPLKLPPINSKYSHEQSSLIQTNEKQHDKLKQNSNDSNHHHDDGDDVDNQSEEENVIINIEHSLSFNTPVQCSMETVNIEEYNTADFEETNQVEMSTLDTSDHHVYSDDHTDADDLNKPLLEHDSDNILTKPNDFANKQRHSIRINLEPILPVIETNNNNLTMFGGTSRRNSIPLKFTKSIGANWPHKTARSDKENVQFAFVPINELDVPDYSPNEIIEKPVESKSERLTVRKHPVGQITQSHSDILEGTVLDSLKKIQKPVKQNIQTQNTTIKRAIKPRPNPDDFCMTMWSYQEVRQEEVPLPELLTILLSGKPDLISKRIFAEIQPDRNLAQELRTVVETICRYLPKSHTYGNLADFIGLRPGYKLEVQILKHGHTQKIYKNLLIKTLTDAFKHSTIQQQQITLNQLNSDLEKLISQISEVCSIIATELIGVDTIKPSRNFIGLNIDTLIMNLIKGAIYDTALANRGILSRLLASAGGGVEALIQLLTSKGGGVEGLMKLLATGVNLSDALGELLNSLDDNNPLNALKQLANALGGGASGVDVINTLLSALGGGSGSDEDKRKAFKELIKQVGGGVEGLKNLFEFTGDMKQLIESVFGEGAEGLAALIATVGGEFEGLQNLIQAAGGGVDGIKNLIGLAGDQVTGLKNLLTAIGGDNVADALSTLLKATGNIKDGLSALLGESSDLGLANLIEAIGGGVEGLKNLLKATGDNPTEALANILTAIGGGVDGLKNLLEVVGGGGGVEGLKNLFNLMGNNPSEALMNILKATAAADGTGGGNTVDALKCLLESLGGGGQEGLQILLQSLGDNPVEALANLIASIGGVGEGGGGGVEEGLKNLIEAVGGGATGLMNLLNSLGGSSKEALEALFTVAGGGIEGLNHLIAAAGGGVEGLKNILEAVGGGLEGLKTILSSLGDEPVEALRTLLTNMTGGIANLIAAAGDGVSGLTNLFNAIGGGDIVEGFANLLNALSNNGDMNEALMNLLSMNDNQGENLKNLIQALGGGVDGLENLLKVINNNQIGLEGLLNALGGGVKGLTTLLNSFDQTGNKEEIIRKLIELSGGGVEGLAALLKSTGGSIESIKEILNAFGGGPEALAKLLMSCGDNPEEALKVLLTMLGGDENALRNLLLASGIDPNDPDSLKLFFESLGGADVGLNILFNALGGGDNEEGMKRLLKTFGDNGLVNLIKAAGGEQNGGLEALIKAISGGKSSAEGLSMLINLLGGKENGLATLIAAVGGGQIGLAALLKVAKNLSEDGDGLAALITAVGGGVEGLEVLINAIGGGEEGLNNLLEAAGATDASAKANILKTLINAGGGGQEGFNNILKILSRRKNERPIDGLANLLKVLGNNSDSLGILFEAIGNSTTDGLADILAAAGGGAEALQLLLNTVGGGAEGLMNLLAAAKLDNLQQLADVLAVAGLSDDIVTAARLGNLSELSELVARKAATENYLRTGVKDLCKEEKAWLRTRPTGPINFFRKITTTKRNYKRWKKLAEKALEQQKEQLDFTILPEFSQSTTIDSSVLLNHHANRQSNNEERLKKFSTHLNPNILNTIKTQLLQLDRKIDFDLKETDQLEENEHVEEQRLIRQKVEEVSDDQTFDSVKIHLSNSENDYQTEEELLLESKRLIEAFDQHVNMRKKLRDEEILAKYKEYQDEGILPELEGIQQDIVNTHELELAEELTEALDEVEEIEEEEVEEGEIEAMKETHDDFNETKRVKSKLLIVHDLLRERIGLERSLKITPAFVWSYFELLRKMKKKLPPLEIPGGQESNETIELNI
ncbi:unnamed protein product [Schistosoma turkestanicum]|nr:unnamed protein product [Schistosoma turkestanicum]